jgi:hypothetical protein
MVIRSMLIAIAHRAGALLLGGVFLWQVVEHAGPQKSEAAVHLSENNVDVVIDDQAYHVENWVHDAPIVTDMRPGHHTLRMMRAGKTLFEQEFDVVPGKDVVLSAWDQTKPKPDETSTSTATAAGRMHTSRYTVSQS